MLFAEVFASTLLCLAFLSLKYRKDLVNKARDPVLNAAALAVSLFVVCSVTYSIVGDSLINPIIAFVDILQTVIFLHYLKPTASTYLSVGNGLIRCLAPFIGSVIAALVFSYQIDVLEQLSQQNNEMRKEEAVKSEKMFGSLLKDSDSKIEI